MLHRVTVPMHCYTASFIYQLLSPNTTSLKFFFSRENIICKNRITQKQEELLCTITTTIITRWELTILLVCCDGDDIGDTHHLRICPSIHAPYYSHAPLPWHILYWATLSIYPFATLQMNAYTQWSTCVENTAKKCRVNFKAQVRLIGPIVQLSQTNYNQAFRQTLVHWRPGCLFTDKERVYGFKNWPHSNSKVDRTRDYSSPAHLQP